VSGPAAERLKDKYQSKLNKSESDFKTLKEKQKEIKDTHTTGLSQIDMMSDLVRLLQLKVQCEFRKIMCGDEMGVSNDGADQGCSTQKICLIPRFLC